MMFTRAGLSGVTVIVGNDSAQPLFPLNFALSRWAEIGAKNLVPDIGALMRSLLIIVREPFPVDVVKLVKAHAEKVVQTLPFYLSDVIFRKRIRHGRAHRRTQAFHPLTLPECPEPLAVFGVSVMDQVPDLNAQILKPHGCISGLLKHPFLFGIKRRRTHENPTASKMDKNEHIGINPTAPGKDRFGKEVGGGKRVHMGADKQLPVAWWTSATFFWNGVVSRPFEDITDGRGPDADAELHQLALYSVASPRKVLNGKPHDQIHRRLRRSRTTGLLRFIFIVLPQPSPVGVRFNHQKLIVDIMVKLRSKPGKFSTLFRACVNSIRINAGLKHSDLIGHQLETGIVPSSVPSLKKFLKHLKHPQKTAHISSNPTNQILLTINVLSVLISFRAPRKVKEFANLSKQVVYSHPKAGSGVGKFGRQWLGLENG